MFIPSIITFVICLGIPFLISFRVDEPRRFRRIAVLIGVVVMLVVALFLPHESEAAAANKDDSSVANAVVSGSMEVGCEKLFSGN